MYFKDPRSIVPLLDREKRTPYISTAFNHQGHQENNAIFLKFPTTCYFIITNCTRQKYKHYHSTNYTCNKLVLSVTPWNKNHTQ